MKKSTSERIFNIFNILLMLGMSAVMVYPYLNQMAISINDGQDTMMGGITVWPRVFTLVNYRTILSNSSIMQSTLVTVIVVICTTLLTLMACTGAAYALAEKKLPFRNFLIWFLLIPMYISAGIIPIYILYRYLRLLNNIMVYIIPGAFTFYNMIIIRTFINSLPGSLCESALLDGANEVQVLYKIILPLCKPVIATVALWTMVAAWNNWITTLYFVNDKKLFTLQYLIMQIIKQSEVIQKMTAETALTGGEMTRAQPTSESVKAAAIIFSTIPIVITYPFLQKYFVKGVTIGAVKD